MEEQIYFKKYNGKKNMGWLRKKIGQEKRADSSETKQYVVENIIKVVSARGVDEGLEKLEKYMDKERILIDRGANADIEHEPSSIERTKYVKEIFYRILDEELHQIESLDQKLSETEQQLEETISDGEIGGKHEAQTLSDKLTRLRDGDNGEGKYSQRKNGYRTLLNLSDFLVELAEAEDMGERLPEEQVRKLKEVCKERIEMIDTVNSHFARYIAETHSKQAAEKIERELRETYREIEKEEHEFIEEMGAEIES